MPQFTKYIERSFRKSNRVDKPFESKFHCLLILLAVSICLSESNVSSFEAEKIYAGANIGFVNFGNALAFTFSCEYGFDEQIGLFAELSFSSFSDIWSRYRIKYSFLAILFGGTYHLRPDEELDPYLKFGLGYFSFNYKEPFTGAPYTPVYANGLGYTGQIGARYLIKDGIFLKAGVGFPFFFSAGLEFRFDF